MTKFINPPDCPDFRNVGLSLAAMTGDLVWAAGMASDRETNARMAEADTVANETRICLRQIESCLKEAGSTMADVVKTTCYLSDQSFRAESMTAYREFFQEDKWPARCTFVVGIGSDCRVEIDVVAVKGAGMRAD